PMCCLAAHAGPRRSEMLRMKVADVDIAGKTITVHERKRVKGKATTRRVPMSTFLVGVMRQWLADHPVGPWLFCREPIVARSRTRSSTTGHRGQKTRPKSSRARKACIKLRQQNPAARLTKDEAHDHFKRTLQGSRWGVLRGWHVLRHSFISACAS